MMAGMIRVYQMSDVASNGLEVQLAFNSDKVDPILETSSSSTAAFGAG